jgi:hypothetical protein
MSELRALIDRLGPPPAEVCLEWAWQLHHLVGDRLDQPLEWPHVQVVEDGSLSLSDEWMAASSPRSGQASIAGTTGRTILHQLIGWSGYPIDVDDANSDPSQELVKATRLIVDSGRQASESSPTSSNAFGSGRRQRPQHSGPARRKGTRRSTSRGRMIAVAVTGACVLLAASVSFFHSSSTSSSSTSSSGSSSERKAGAADQRDMVSSISQSRAATSGNTTSERPAQLEVSEVTTHDESLTSMLGDDRMSGSGLPSDLLFDRDRSAHLWNGFDLPVPAATGLNLQGSGGADVPALVDGQTGNNGLKPAGEEVSKVVLGGAAEPELSDGIDMLSELKRLSAAADHAETVDELPITSSPAKPLVVKVSPPRSIQRLDEAPKINARQPAWQLRLESIEGVTISPPELQMLSGREAVQWRIEKKDAKQPVTAVEITAQLVNSRSAAIRWSVTAKPDDIPHLRLPAERELLDKMQFSLSGWNSQLSGRIDGLRTQARIPGVPSGARSEMYRQRRELELQLEIGQRLLQIVADSNELSGLIGPDIQVHGALIDSRAPGSPPLLQFGQAENTSGD